jgi:hypothetical protein
MWPINSVIAFKAFQYFPTHRPIIAASSAYDFATTLEWAAMILQNFLDDIFVGDFLSKISFGVTKGP